MRHSFLLPAICLLLAVTIPLSAQENGLFMPSVDPVGDSIAFARVRARMDSIRRYRPTVAVILGGGGARGMAHLGVLKYMEEQGIPIDLIGGTSMGGLVAGLYALGYSEETLDSLVKAIDWSVMMSDKVPDSYQSYRVRHLKERFLVNIPFHYDSDDIQAGIRRQVERERQLDKVEARSSEMAAEAIGKIGLGIPDGLLFGFNVHNQLTSVSVGYQDSLDFDRLPIPYFCVATDMLSMSEKNWTSGELVEAMRSTMAIPLYFRPVRMDGMVLSDGGTRNNFPVDVARAMGADIVIGSEMPVNRKLEDLGTLVSLAMQNISMMSSDAARANRKHVDILIQHELSGFNMLSFDDESIGRIIDAGYENTLPFKEAFSEVSRMTGCHETGQKAGHAIDIARQKVKVSRIDFKGIDEKEGKLLYNHFLVPKDSLFDRSAIEDVLSEIYGSRAFESVTYHLEGSKEPYVLSFECKKGQTSEFNAGIHADNDEKVYLGLRLGLGTRKLSGTRFVTEMKVGNCPSLLLDLSYKPAMRAPIFGVALNNRYTDVRCFDIEGNQTRVQSLNTRGEVYIEDARYVHGTLRAGYSVEMEPYENYLVIDEEWTGWDMQSRWHSVFGRFRFDNLNDSYFPTRGLRADLDLRYVFRGYSAYMWESFADTGGYTKGAINPYGVGVASLSWATALGKRLTLQPSLHAGWCSESQGHINYAHTIAAGGIRAARYGDYQMPFFGFSSGFRILRRFSGIAQADLRYRFGRKLYLTAQGALLQDADDLHGMWSKAPTTWAAGAEIGYKTIGGPLKIGIHWCGMTGFGITGSYGFYF